MKVKVTTTATVGTKEYTKSAEADVPASFGVEHGSELSATVQTLLRALKAEPTGADADSELLRSAASALDDLIGFIEKQPVSKPVKLLGKIIKDSPGFIRAKAIHSVIREVLSTR